VRARARVGAWVGDASRSPQGTGSNSSKQGAQRPRAAAQHSMAAQHGSTAAWRQACMRGPRTHVVHGLKAVQVLLQRLRELWDVLTQGEARGPSEGGLDGARVHAGRVHQL